ncbi:4Fe-4S binding protein [Megasphaera vaginalis (ex Srinivasan et al. 2021)]|uniref:4Fe-4S binding domain protein n=1 Tax=Megasphaera vaginalis (ex Srinivasan et al. 2021) TaxID=1111454 RepID=U7UIL0_9FIRM|nr:4Fe-4S binding protein [Megasphaera vaginalis (ex Srinivasan et al. 2021)]ERT59257.1 4Fe-4S binding domain protein [Megasphaera vaginalis (ex Srinivasan et al. 2021)]
MDKRTAVQGLWSAVTNGNWDGFLQGSVYPGPLKSFCLPGLNCYSCPGALGACPVGALQSACSGVVLRIPFYVVGTLLLAALLCGRFICGWFCPFGFVQELLYRLPGKKLRKSPRLRRLTYGKYGMAAFVAAVPLLLFGLTGIGEPAFCKYLCPAGTLEAAVPLLAVSERLRAAAGWLTAGKFLLLALLLLAAVPVYRPFCRFFCPLGAFYGFFNKTALFGIAVKETACTHCGACARRCPMDVRRAGDRECISCGACRRVCPSGAIAFKRPFPFSLKEDCSLCSNKDS